MGLAATTPAYHPQPKTTRPRQLPAGPVGRSSHHYRPQGSIPMSAMASLPGLPVKGRGGCLSKRLDQAGGRSGCRTAGSVLLVVRVPPHGHEQSALRSNIGALSRHSETG